MSLGHAQEDREGCMRGIGRSRGVFLFVQLLHTPLIPVDVKRRISHAYDYNEGRHGDLLKGLGQGSAHRL